MLQPPDGEEAPPPSPGKLKAEPGLDSQTLKKDASANKVLPRGGMFADKDDMKKKVRDALMKPEYNVADFYHKTGIWSKIATNPIFETVTLAVISFNALWISIDTDLNGAATLLDAQPVFQYLEHFFCWYFALEWYVRFSSFEVKRNGLKDAWFVFDSCLVFMMVTETWLMTTVLLLLGGSGAGSALGNASILRLLRLLRLSRLARMLRSMPELMILIKGMVAASRSVFFTMMLLVILLYLFAIAMRQLTEGTEAGELLFPSVPSAMFKLLIEGVFLDNMGFTTDVLSDSSPVFTVVFLIFVSLAALMVMNMLIGVLCEVVGAVASTEKEAMTVGALKFKLQQVMDQLSDERHDDPNATVQTRTLSEEEFGKLVSNKDAIMMLKEVGVDPESLIDMGPVIFAKEDEDDEEDEARGEFSRDNGKEIELEDLMNIVLELRDKNVASQKDLKALKHSILSEIELLRQDMGGKRRKSRRGSTNLHPPDLGDRWAPAHEERATSPRAPALGSPKQAFWQHGLPLPEVRLPVPKLPPTDELDALKEQPIMVEELFNAQSARSKRCHALVEPCAEARAEVERSLEALQKALGKAQESRQCSALPGAPMRDASDSLLSSWQDDLSVAVSGQVQRLERLRGTQMGSLSRAATQERVGSETTTEG